MSLEIGQVIDDKYRITKLIGEGGMGAVYAGENLRIKRRVAIKVLHAATAADAEAVARFEREAQAAGCIGNDHILEVLDLGSLPDGARYMVMEFLDGEALGDRIERCGQLTPAQLYPIGRQTLEALRAAHDAGIIHRDLKPDNIFILHEKAGQADYVKLIDFGISKFSPLGGDAVTRMTRTGAIMGTPYYMAPEQANGSRAADPRSDLYAIGVILYEAVTGKVPFEAETVNELLFKIVLSAPTPPQVWAPDLDAAFGSIVLKAMAREAEDRFQTAAEFLAALDAWASDGKAVAVPVLRDGKATMVAKLEAAAKTGKGKTTQSWASAGPEQAPAPTAAWRRMGAVLPVAVALTLGGLGVGGYLLLRSESAPIAPANEPQVAAAAPSAAPNLPATAPTALTAEPRVAPADSAMATPSASAAPAATTTPSAGQTAAAPTTSAVATAPPKPAIPVAAPSTKPTAKPPAAPTTKPTVDLGY
jgi:serine/threonine-protein kinase